MIKAEQLQLSLQSVVSNVYKGLRAQQNELHIRMTDVKSSVSLAPLSTTELATALSIAIQSLLARQLQATAGQPLRAHSLICLRHVDSDM